jgi:hypothetical protein
LEEIKGEIVMPHPGSQRRLRIELEEKHRLGKAPTDELEGLEEEMIPMDQSDNNRMPLNSRG